jgi:hypothetical protein
MPTAAEDRTSDFRLTERDLEGDLDMTVREEELLGGSGLVEQ